MNRALKGVCLTTASASATLLHNVSSAISSAHVAYATDSEFYAELALADLRKLTKELAELDAKFAAALRENAKNPEVAT